MAAVATASSLCPGLASSSNLNKPRGHCAKPRRATVCHYCLPTREEEEGRLKRRDVVLSVLFSTAVAASSAPLLAPAQALAEAADMQEGFSAYEDEPDKFSIMIPQGWLLGAGETSGNYKSVTAFYPEQTADSSAS